jgi:protein MpaA
VAKPASAPVAQAAEVPAKVDGELKETASDLQQCTESVKSMVRAPHRERLEKFCRRMQHLAICASSEGRAIPHVEFLSTDPRAKRVLVLGLIHGDEFLAGEMTMEWAERLGVLREKKIEPRNSWRVIPILNPDGLRAKTRMNAHGVDLNRNFPTKDWNEEARKFWKKQGQSDPRRFPGDSAASEAETKCVIAQIKEFKPDFIVSVHTPYHVLDFDGPKMSFPHYKDLPWRALGNFPGSLGRYMWHDYQIPVLTVELGQTMVDAANLQDIVGTFAIDAVRKSGQKQAGLFDML